MTKPTSDYICTRTHTKADYDHEWYLANRTYKRLCSRLHRRIARFRKIVKPEEPADVGDLTAKADAFHEVLDTKTAIRVIQDNRRELVARGKWLDERDGTEYMGITPRTYVQLVLDLDVGD